MSYNESDLEVNNTIARASNGHDRDIANLVKAGIIPEPERKKQHRGHWFRVYDSILNDPKVQQLSAKNFRGLINLWSLTSQKDGAFLWASDIAFGLRIKPNEAIKMLAVFKDAELVDETPEGFRPHNWQSRQRKSDMSNERVKRYRDRLQGENVT